MVKNGAHDRCGACSDSGAHFAQMGLTKHIRERQGGRAVRGGRPATPLGRRQSYFQGSGEYKGADPKVGSNCNGGGFLSLVLRWILQWSLPMVLLILAAEHPILLRSRNSRPIRSGLPSGFPRPPFGTLLRCPSLESRGWRILAPLPDGPCPRRSPQCHPQVFPLGQPSGDRAS